jgi:hypothetical protein
MSNPVAKQQSKKPQDQAAPARKPEVQAGGTERWSAVTKLRLPHKMGLPLGSGGCGDEIGR